MASQQQQHRPHSPSQPHLHLHQNQNQSQHQQLHHQRYPSLSALSETSSASIHISSFPVPPPSSSSLHPHAAAAATAAPRAITASPSSVTITQANPLLLSSPPAQSSAAVPGSKNTKGLTLKERASSVSADQPIRRKPLSSTASSSVAAHYAHYAPGESPTASSVRGLPQPEHSFNRSFLADSPTVYEFPQPPAGPMSRPTHWDSTAEPITPGTHDPIVPTHHDHDVGQSLENHEPLSPTSEDGEYAARAAEANPHQAPGNPNPASHHTASSRPDAQALYDDLYPDEDEDPMSDNILDGYDSDSSDIIHSSPINDNTMSSSRSQKPLPPRLIIKSDDTSRKNSTTSNGTKTPNTDKPLPKSPGSSRLGSFFGWTRSPTVDHSEKLYSPLTSAFSFSKSGSQPDGSPVVTSAPQSAYEASKAEFSTSDSLDCSESYLVTVPPNSSEPITIDEMEEELKAISAELAASIRRELDLEDMVDRLQSENHSSVSEGNRRASDYYSDSGYSSTKLSDIDQSREEIEKIQRRSEQEKAQLRLELTTKLQDERLRRQKMDEQIRDLSTKASQIDIAAINSAEATNRVKELEATCESLRRKLSEEREAKDNIGDMLSALKGELEDTSNERDNLRDEVVPQLRAQVEGLETQASEFEKMAYESTRMQQELDSLRNENSNLKQFQMSSISEEPGTVSAPLSRSNSVGGSRSSLKSLQPQQSSLSRSNTVKVSSAVAESRDQLSERLKDVEQQRDALHSALKNLLERQEHQNRENQKKIRYLEMERDRLMSSSPRKASFHKEISYLRAEIIVLRRRAEEALDHKWQVEKGLAGLKMDLDKAKQEVRYLRNLLEEKDILIPPSFARFSTSCDQLAAPVTSQSLTAAYHDLQKAYEESLERIRNLETDISDEKTQTALQKLETALSLAVSERDFAQYEAESYKEQVAALKAGEQAYLESEKALADELAESARRVEELALQVQQQLSINQQLRERITDTITRGDATQKANAERITSMQAHLRSLEEKLEAAQAASEDRVAFHEEEMLGLKDNHNLQLTRRRDQLRANRNFPAKSGLSPLFTTPGASTPRLTMTRSGPAMNVSEATQVDYLKGRVAELEKALLEADAEMEQVVGRMNSAQIEVLHLQEEREAAIDQTRKLERALQEERSKVFEGRFKALLA